MHVSYCTFVLLSPKKRSSRAAKRGGFPIWTRLCRFVLSCLCWEWIFPVCPGIFPICPFPLPKDPAVLRLLRRSKFTIDQRAPNSPEFAQPRLSRVKARSSPARGYKFGCVCSYMAGQEDARVVTGHIGTNTPKFCTPSLGGRPRVDPTQTGLCKSGWVWSSLSPKCCCNLPSLDSSICARVRHEYHTRFTT